MAQKISIIGNILSLTLKMSSVRKAVRHLENSVANSDTVPLGVVLVSKQCGYCKSTLKELNDFLKSAHGKQFEVIVLERKILQGIQNALSTLANSKRHPADVTRPLRQIAQEIGKLQGFPTFLRQVHGADSLTVDRGAKTKEEICEFLAGNLAHLRCPDGVR